MKSYIALCSNICPIPFSTTDINEGIKVMYINSLNVTKLGRIYNV